MRKLEAMSNEDLIKALGECASVERAGQVELLRYLAEMSRRELFLELGFSSMWDYCRRALKFSESVSQQRIVVARAAGRFPGILDRIGDGRLSLCAAADLVPMLDDKNAEAMLDAAEGKTRREVQAMGVAAGAKPVRRDVIRRVSAPSALPLAQSPVPEAASHSLASAPVPAQRSAPVLLRVAFTASAEVVAKLEKLQSLLGDATLEDVVGKAADLLLAKVDSGQRQARRESRKAALPSPKPKTMPRRPPSPIRDRVLLASGQRCEFVSPSGRRCAETKRLQIDHVRPYALGGTSIDERNLRCLCAAHNRYFGRMTFGDFRPHDALPAS